MGTSMLGQQEEKMELIPINAEALHEISQLQEDILHTLRSELRKLKEPEVIGASNASTPVFEIGQDMTPLPSVHGSTVLQPIRLYSPIARKTNRRRHTGKVARESASSRKSFSSSCSSRKYDYRSRNYPRPWAETPRRRRTLSGESLEVHVTSSHFSDLSTLSREQDEATEQDNDLLSVAIMEAGAINVAHPTDSSETWRNSVKSVISYKSSSKPSMRRSVSGNYRYTSRPRPHVNHAFHHGQSTGAGGGTVKPVIFPRPVEQQIPRGQQDSKLVSKLALGANDTNNNNSEIPVQQMKFTANPVNISEITPDQIALLKEFLFQKLRHSKSIQTTLLQDQEAQTEHVLSTFSSQFELGLFIATLLDELVDGASRRSTLRQSVPPDDTSTVIPEPKKTQKRALSETNIKDANNNELFKQPVTTYNCLTSTMIKSVATEHSQRSTNHQPTTKTTTQCKPDPKCPAHETSGKPKLDPPPNIPVTIGTNVSCSGYTSPTRSQKNFATSPIKRRYARVSSSRRRRHTPTWQFDSEHYDHHTGNQGIQSSCLQRKSSHRNPASINSVPAKIINQRNSTIPSIMTDMASRHWAKNRRKFTSWRKRLLHHHHMDTSEDSDALPDDNDDDDYDASTDSNSYSFKDDYLLITEDDEDNNNIFSHSKTHQHHHHLHPRRRPGSSRKRNIKMSSYRAVAGAPEFSDLFPHAEIILREAKSILSKQHYSTCNGNDDDDVHEKHQQQQQQSPQTFNYQGLP